MASHKPKCTWPFQNKSNDEETPRLKNNENPDRVLSAMADVKMKQQ